MKRNGDDTLLDVTATESTCFSHVVSDLKFTRNNIIDLCQKVLVADLQLAVSLIFYLPDEFDVKLIKELFSWAISNQNSRVVFYVSRLAQMVAFVTKDAHSRYTIFESYRGAWWSRRLAHEGITSQNVNVLLTVHADFISSIGSLLLYKEYCDA
uniref:Uncharacterized protein n=1 Tax=Panagrolaimus davidi TaxID=227884 RepID=A0A914R583_9BILA